VELYQVFFFVRFSSKNFLPHTHGHHDRFYVIAVLIRDTTTRYYRMGDEWVRRGFDSFLETLPYFGMMGVRPQRLRLGEIFALTLSEILMVDNCDCAVVITMCLSLNILAVIEVLRTRLGSARDVC